MPRSYVDNAMNRSLGRVGMTHGTAVHSSSSGGGYSGGGGSSYSSSSSSRTYVDNAQNRSLGRVGMAHGTAVHSSSSGGGNSSYSSSSGRTYADNSMNRSLGRVGMAHGTAVHSSSSGGGLSSSSSKTYVDNSQNRSLGRVGLPHGSAVHSASPKSTSGSFATKTGSSSSRGVTGSGTKCYVDNPYNRRLGRVGRPLGTCITSQKSTAVFDVGASVSIVPRRYVDNPLNRKLGRVGLIVGTAVCPSFSKGSSNNSSIAVDQVFRPLQRLDPEDNDLGEVLERIVDCQREKIDDLEHQLKCEKAKGVVHRLEAGVSQYRAGLQRPSWVRGGEIINNADLELGEKMGGGGFGDVFVAIWKRVNQVAVKKLRVQRVSQQKKEQFQKEVKVFSALSHPAIITFYGVCPTPPNLAIVMEFMPAGSLHDVLHVENRILTPEQKFQMGSDCAAAVKYLHEKEITHRDIKTMNILVTEDHSHCKLADFGLALKEESRASGSVANHEVVGTLRYSPPEVLKGKRLTLEQLKAVDIYAMAFCLIELLTHKEIFRGKNQHQVRAAVLEGERPSLIGVPSELVTLLTLAMSQSSLLRPSATQFQSQWLQFGANRSLTESFSRLTTSEPPRSSGSGSTTLNSESVRNSSLRSGSSSSSSTRMRVKCAVCLENDNSHVFRCGHLVCSACLPQLRQCHQCRGPVDQPIRVFL